MCLSLAKTPELPFPLFSDYLSFQNLFCPSTASGQVRSPLPKSLLSPEARFSPHSARRCRWPQTSDVYFRNRFTHWLYRTEPPPKPACACPSIAVPLRCLPRRASTAPCRVQCPSHGSGVPALPQIWAVLWDQGAAGGSWGAGGHLKDKGWQGHLKDKTLAARGQEVAMGHPETGAVVVPRPHFSSLLP